MPKLLLAKLPNPVHSDSDTLRSQWHTGKSEDKIIVASGKNNQQGMYVIKSKMECSGVSSTKNMFES